MCFVFFFQAEDVILYLVRSRGLGDVYKRQIYFDFNSKSLGLSKGELDVLIKYMKDHKDVSIEVVGHTDNIGSWETNFWLSHKRAKSVYDYLFTKGTVSYTHLTLPTSDLV